MTRLALPPTRDHRQLANWINAHALVDDRGRPVCARVEPVTTSTDSRVAGTRLRRVGRGRRGLLLEIWLVDKRFLGEPKRLAHREARLYQHASSETYRRHSEARAWVEQNLRRSKRRGLH